MATKKSSETSRRILAAAFRRIALKGCGQVTLREIAEEAGVVLSQLNYYYNNKETLFAHVLRAMQQDYVEAIAAGLSQRPGFQEQIAFLIQYNKNLLVENRDLYRAFLEFFNLAMGSEPFRVEMNQFLQSISAAIEQHIHREESVPGVRLQEQSYEQTSEQSRVLTRMILGTSFGIAMQVLMEPGQAELLAGFDVLQALVAQGGRIQG